MKRFLNFFGALALVGVAIGIGLVAAYAIWGDAVLGHTVIQIGDESISVQGLNGMDGMSSLIAAGGLVLAAVIVMLVVPLAVLLPLLLVLLVLAGVLLLLAGVVALIFSPLLVPAALIWMLWRLSRPSRPAATIRA